MKAIRLPGIVSYAVIALWFLLTIMTPIPARAEEPAEVRAAVMIKVADILPSIEAALMKEGAAPNAQIILEAPETPIMITPGQAPTFDSVSINPLSGRFLIRARGGGAMAPVTIAGRAAVTTRYPVLSRLLNRGDIISQADIAYLERNDLQASLFITDPSMLIGKQARRPLRADAPLRRNDVVSPELVKKGALVTMFYQSEGVRLSHHGIAGQSGAMGDVISIENVKSERTVKAVITGANLARVVGSRQNLTVNQNLAVNSEY